MHGSLFTLIFISSLMLALRAPVVAAPITFNTALPVAEGEGIVRIQARYIRSAEDPTSQDRSLTIRAFPVVGAYGVTERLAVFGIVPFLDKELEATAPAGRVSRGGTGIGDITLVARYTVWRKDSPGQTVRIAPFAALEVPSGEDDEEDSLGRLPQPLQLGSGSWDPSVGVVFTWQTLARQIDASGSYKFNTEANNFEFGDVARLDASYQHRLHPQKLGSGVPAFVYGVLESSLVWTAENKANGMEDPNSGGTSWFLVPGIQFVARRIVAEAALRLPVVQELNGRALENDFTVIFSLRANF